MASFLQAALAATPEDVGAAAPSGPGVTIDHPADQPPVIGSSANGISANGISANGASESGSLGPLAHAEIPSDAKSEVQRHGDPMVNELVNAIVDPMVAPVVNPMDDYVRLQRRLMMATLAVSAAAVPLSWICFGGSAAASLLLGACSGLLYLRLLARSVARIGSDSRSIGRFQLLVPTLLVMAAIRIPAIELLPALAGFVLYKPALLLQAVLAP
jgi:ATP synthase protein I